MPPHGARLVAIRRVGAAPALLASSFHFSQGKEITAWQASAAELTFTLELGRLAEGELRLALPFAPTAVLVDGQVRPIRSEAPGVYALAFPVNRIAHVQIRF